MPAIAAAYLRCRRRGAMAALGLLLAALLAAVPAWAQSNAGAPIIVDFNADGIPDVLLPSTTSPTATIAFGTVPYGTFSGASKALTLPPACSGPAAGSLLAGDFTGDGFPDIVFLCGGGNGTAGVLPGNGDGTFASPKTFGGVFSASGVVGDFNGDGKLDLVVVGLNGFQSTTQEIEFFSGNGDGTFATPVLSTLASGSSFSAPVAVDVRQSGSPDLVVGQFNTSGPATIDIFGNNGDGTFGVVTAGASAPNVSAAVGTYPASTDQSILIGNFFGTGKPDFAVVDTGSAPGLFVLQNTSSTTAYSLAAAVKTASAGLENALAGSFTGSGFSDFAVANGTQISVLANDGAGNFSASYGSLLLPATSPAFAAVDANGDGYTDIYTLTQQSGSFQISVNLVNGSASATSQPFSLGAGSRPVSATWSGNVNFTGSTASGTQVVNNVPTLTTLASSKNPSTVGDTVTFTAAVASSQATPMIPGGTVTFTDGSAALGSSSLDSNGAASITVSTLAAGTHSIQAAYSGDAYFATSSSAALSQVVNPTPVTPILIWPTPAPIPYGTPLSATQLNASATNASGQPVPGAYAYKPPAGTVLQVGTQTLYVTFTPTDTVTYTAATASVSLTVTPSSPSITLTGPPSAPPGTQPSLTLTINNPYPADVTANFTLTFAGSDTPPVDDPAVQFASGGRTYSFVVPANSTEAPPIPLQVGTDAGTVTVTPQLVENGVDVTPTSLLPVSIVVPRSIPVLSTVTVTRSSGQLSVAIHGFSNTRELTQASFHFTPAPGAHLDTPDIEAQVGVLFNNWYSSQDSIQFGSTFTYTQIFEVDGDPADVGSIEVVLTNSVGASAPNTAQ